jgi:serine/threonine-protein kinase
MPDEPRVRELLDELLDHETTPEEVCSACQELLPVVRERWGQICRARAEFDALLPVCTQGNLATMLPEDLPLPQIPGYEIEAELGRGGMGIVFRARQLRLGRLVALKMTLAGCYAGPQERERFRREAEAVAALRHANVVQIYDVSDWAGRSYFTMELIEGGSLAQRLAGVPQPARQAAALLATLAETMHAAHEGGIIHRDLKPANILFAADGTPKITDFGLARRLEGGGALTLSGFPLGTPSYMAPEQARGQSRAIGPAVDVYALGAILYEHLTGRPPFRAETPAETLRQVIDQEPVPPARLNVKVPRDLETVCLKCLQKEPHRRYASAAALADDLGRFQRCEPITARPVGRLERSGKWVRRNPGATVAAVSIVTLLATAAVVVERSLWSRAELLRGVHDDLAASERFERRGDWGNAREALERVKGRLGERDVSDARARLRQSEHDLQLVAELAAIRLSSASLNGKDLKWAEAAAQYENTFGAAGLNLQALPPATVADRIKVSPIRNELIAALDDWSACVFTREQLEKIYDVARSADPDRRWRDKVRDASIINNVGAMTDLANEARIDQQSASILLALGRRIELAGGDSIQFCRRVQLQYPNDFWANLHLASMLQTRRNPESIDYYLAARAIRPDALIVYINLSADLTYYGRSADALEYARRAVGIDPRSATAQANLGVCLMQLGRYDEAIASCRNALAINPKHVFAVGVMCEALIGDGRLVEANAAAQKCIEEMPNDSPYNGSMRSMAVRCKDLVEREQQVGDVLGGKKQVTAQRRCQIAAACLLKKRYRDSVQLFDEAFTAQPALADDLISRFEAACAAVKAGEEAGGIPERVRLLNKAITWLRADLDVWSKVLPRGNELERQSLLRAMYPWRWEPRLASIRDPQRLRGWPPEQRAQCRTLWQSVDTLIMLAQAAAPSADAAAQIDADPLQQGRKLVAQGDWIGAVNCYARTLAQGPNDDGEFWFEYAGVLLLCGDRSGYRAACTRLIDRCGQPGTRAYHVARAGTLAADAAPDVSLLDQLTHNELQQNANQFWSLTERGALAYRAGRFHDAVALFEQSLKADSRPGRAVVNWVWLALAQQRLGKTEEARHWLEKAQGWLDQYRDGIPPNADPKLRLHLHNWLEANVLRREAEAMLLLK